MRGDPAANVDETLLNRQLDIWLDAWATNNQLVLAEVGNHPLGVDRPWFGFDGYRPVRFEVRSVVSGSAGLMLAHVRVLLTNQILNTGLLTDLGVVVEDEGGLLRVKSSAPLGLPT